MSDNDIQRKQAHTRSELRRALVSEEGSLDGIKTNRHFFIFECQLVLNHQFIKFSLNPSSNNALLHQT